MAGSEEQRQAIERLLTAGVIVCGLTYAIGLVFAY